MSMQLSHVKYLNSKGAATIKHSGRYFIDHLKGTYYLLKEWKNPEPVCVAGLFHSIYGTEFFHSAIVDMATQREEIKSLIGVEAELLAYYFCFFDRKKFLENLGVQKIYGSKCGSEIEISKEMERQLCEIATANILEQHPSFTCDVDIISELGLFMKQVDGYISAQANDCFTNNYLARRKTAISSFKTVSTESYMAKLLAPISIEEFKNEYLGKKFLYLPGAKDRFSHLFSWKELNHFLRHHDHHRSSNDGDNTSSWHSRIRVYGAGDGSIFTPLTGRFSPFVHNKYRLDKKRVDEALLAGGSVEIFAIDETRDSLMELTEKLTDFLCQDVYCYLFSSVNSSVQGLPTHFDMHDIYVIQLEGSKDWTVYEPIVKDPSPKSLDHLYVSELRDAMENPENASPYFRDQLQRLEQNIVWTGRLTPGDFLYLPQGWFHRVVPTHESSMHLSCPAEPSNACNLIEKLVEDVLSSVPVCRMNIPALGDRTTKFRYIEDLKRVISERLNTDFLELYLAEMRNNKRTLVHYDYPASLRPIHVPNEGNLKISWNLSHGVTIKSFEHLELFKFMVDGSEIEFTGHTIAGKKILEFIYAHRVVKLEDIYNLKLPSEVDHTLIRAFLTALAQNNVIEIGDHPNVLSKAS